MLQYLRRICPASLRSAITRDTKEYTWPTNWWIIFVYFLEYWLKNVLVRHLVHSMQNHTQSTKWHSAINLSMWSTYLPPRYISVFPFKSRVRHVSYRALQSHNSPGDWVKELFKPSTDSASLVVEIEKRNFRFQWGFLWRWRHKEGMF